MRNRNIRAPARAGGMSRGRFLRGAAAATAGAGLAMAGRGRFGARRVRADTPPNFATAKVLIATLSSAGYIDAAMQAQRVIQTLGITNAYLDMTAAGSNSPSMLQSYISQGYRFIIGSTNSSNSKVINEAIKNSGVPCVHIDSCATADNHNPYYPAGSDYSPDSVYMLRTATTSTSWGGVAAQASDAKFAPVFSSEDPTVPLWGIAHIRRDPDDFGFQVKAGFDKYWADDFFGEDYMSADIRMNATGTSFTYYVASEGHLLTTTNLKDILDIVMEELDVDMLLVGACLSTASTANNAFNVVEKTRLANDQTKDPVNFPDGRIRLVTTGTVNTATYGDANLTFLKKYGVGTIAYYDPNSDGFRAWQEWTKTTGVVDHRALRGFDAGVLIGMGLMAWNTSDIGDFFDLVIGLSRQPGNVVLPNEYPQMNFLRRFGLLNPETLDYNGSSNTLEMKDHGECSIHWYTLWVAPGVPANSDLDGNATSVVQPW